MKKEYVESGKDGKKENIEKSKEEFLKWIKGV